MFVKCFRSLNILQSSVYPKNLLLFFKDNHLNLLKIVSINWLILPFAFSILFLGNYVQEGWTERSSSDKTTLDKC